MSSRNPQSSTVHPLTLGEAVRRRRRELGLRQVDLAELSGLSTRLVETVEQEVGSPRLSSVLALCRALGLELLLQPGPPGLRVEGL